MTSKEIKRIKKTLDTLETGFVKRSKQLFDSIIPEMQPYVKDALRTGSADGFELPGRKRYLVLFKRYLQELYAQGMTLADQELEAKRAKFDQHPSPAPVIPTGAMDWIDKWTIHFGDKYYGEATEDVVRVLKQGLAEGWSTEHTMTQLRVYLTDEKMYNKRRLEVIARTNATSAFNQGRLETFRQAGDFVQFVQFLAILDSRTTDICESRNGRLLRLDSPELAANTPPLHFQCRSILSPVTTYDLKDMEKPGWKDDQGRTLDELQDWSKVDPPAKGFGADIQDKLPKTPGGPPPQIRGPERGQPSEPPSTGKAEGKKPAPSGKTPINTGEMTGGKLGKSKEERNMAFSFTEEEVIQTTQKLKVIQEKYPDLVKDVDEATVRIVAEYIENPELGKPEPEVWERIKLGNIYSYVCYLHEKIEIELRNIYSEYRHYHGGALCEQYLFVQKYLELKAGEEFDIIKLCYSDAWREGDRDKANSRVLKKYLKDERKDLFNPEKHREPIWNKNTSRTAELMSKMRSGELD